VDPLTRQWIDQRWKWLSDQFGSDIMIKSQTILPTHEFFPDHYDRSDESARKLIERVCGYMGVAPSLLDLQFYSNPQRPLLVNEDGHPIGDAAGTYHEGDSHFVIRIERRQLSEPMTLVGTVAHELAHVRLLGEKRIDRQVFDNELLTDLTVVFHGMGIFLANCPRFWRSQMTTWPDSDVPKPQYMTTPMYAYALALRCWLREEPLPPWRKHLAHSVRAEFKQAMRFLQHSNREK
jgi:hypothetical protein